MSSKGKIRTRIGYLNLDLPSQTNGNCDLFNSHVRMTCHRAIVHGFQIAFKDVDSLSLEFMNGCKSIHEI